MLGFTENLPDAIRAFDRGTQPAYTDEPRRGHVPGVGGGTQAGLDELSIRVAVVPVLKRAV